MSQRLFAPDPLIPSRPASDVPLDARKAALVFHALSPEDRAWILAQLPARHGRELQALAEELETLGIPSDQALLQGVLADLPTRREPAASPRDAETGAWASASSAAIEKADPDELARVLSSEQPGLIAYLLDGRAWPWEHALLQRLDPPLRSDVENRRKGLSAGQAVTGAATWSRLLALLEQRLEACPAPAGTSGSASPGAVARILAKAGWRRKTRRAGDERGAGFGSADLEAAHPVLHAAQRRPASIEGES